MTDYELPLLTYQSATTRRRIIVSYWLVIALALPLWWLTTSIERLSLPRSNIDTQTNRYLTHVINIALQSEEPYSIPDDLVQRLEARLKTCSPSLDVKYNIYMAKDLDLAEDVIYTVTLSEGIKNAEIGSRTLQFGMDKNSIGSAEGLSQLLCQMTSPPFTSDDEHRTVQYSSHYRLAFSLLNEDASSGQSIMEWEAKEAIHQFIVPVTSALAAIHNFSIESQLQLQAPLAFPVSRHERYSSLSREQLSVFVNSAEWTLSSAITNDPVLHFLLFVPCPEHRPLLIEGLSEDSGLHSFIIPRWGGVVIYQPPPSTTNSKLDSASLAPPFAIFRSQLLQLLGLPPNGELTDWQLEALMRRRTNENVRDTKQTLGSIVRLVDSIRNMPVGDIVTNDVRDALAFLSKAFDYDVKQALQNSAQALRVSSRAFFQPTMLAMLYFPAEHTFAVYVPLFAPALMPLVVAAFKEFKSRRKNREQSKQKTD